MEKKLGLVSPRRGALQTKNASFPLFSPSLHSFVALIASSSSSAENLLRLPSLAALSASSAASVAPRNPARSELAVPSDAADASAA